jgi:cation diffusion facilitator family transporter
MRMAGGLAVLKAVAGIASGSLGVLASALDSLLDVTASAVNYVSLSVSNEPPDKDHPYGHGKAEALAGLFQGAFIALGGIGLLVESVRRVVFGGEVNVGGVALVAMAVSLTASTVHSMRLKRAAREGGSTVMKTEGAHFVTDVLSNGAVLLVLGVIRWTGWTTADVIVSAGVTVYILSQAWVILRDCVQELMDQGLPADTLVQIETLIRTHHTSVTGFHNLRARRAGGRSFVDFHIEIADVDSFKQAHDITEDLIDKVEALLPGADVTVHYDPADRR